jgi:hypothetical protein
MTYCPLLWSGFHSARDTDGSVCVCVYSVCRVRGQFRVMQEKRTELHTNILVHPGMSGCNVNDKHPKCAIRYLQLMLHIYSYVASLATVEFVLFMKLLIKTDYQNVLNLNLCRYRQTDTSGHGLSQACKHP